MSRKREHFMETWLAKKPKQTVTEATTNATSNEEQPIETPTASAEQHKGAQSTLSDLSHSDSVNVVVQSKAHDGSDIDTTVAFATSTQVDNSDCKASNINIDAANESNGSKSLLLELQGGPYQPSNTSAFPMHVVNAKTRRFQPQWFTKHPWLHYSSLKKAVLCHFCAKADLLSFLSLNIKMETSFVSKGFTNWKNALVIFQQHEKSACYRHAVSQMLQIKSTPVLAQISKQKK